MPFVFRAVILFVLAFLGVLYPYNRGALCTSLVVTYALTSVVAGYTASSFYSQFVETGWVIIVLSKFVLCPLFLYNLIVSFRM